MTMKSACVLAVLCVLPVTPPLFAQQAQSQQVYKILGISVEGNSLADPAAVIASSGLRVGDELVVPSDQIAQAVRKLWSLKIFDDIQIAIDRKLTEGVFLVFKIKEYPRLDATLIEGADGVSEDDIRKKIPLVRGQVVAPQDLRRMEKDIKKLYEEEGYLLARISMTTTPSDTSTTRVNLLVSIEEGQEVEVVKIDVEGNVAFEDGDVTGAMDETSESTWWEFWSSAKLDRKKYEEDKKKVIEFYRKNGYRDAAILSDSIWFSEEEDGLHILLRLHEGPQYYIRSIAWEGNTVYPASALNERLSMYPGEVYDMQKFEQNLRGNESQTDVASLYLDNGYLRFNLDPLELRSAEDSIDLTIRVYENNQFRIGQVNIKGNTKTWDKVIRRELYTRPGDYFSRASIIRSIRQLSVLNYFNPEKIKPDYAFVDDKTVDLTYEVEEKSSDNINASVGYSGAFGFTGALGFTINNFSISEPLSGGAGQILSFEWQFGEASRFRTFSIGFTEPWLFGTSTLFGVSLFDTRQVYFYDLRQTGGSLKIGRRFRWPDDYFRGDWILTGVVNKVNEGRNLYRSGNQVSLTQIISRNSIDNPTFPTMGSNISLSTEISGGPFLPGNFDYFKWVLDLNFYIPLFGGNRVALFAGFTWGSINPLESGNGAVPPIELFFMGGTGLGYINTTPLRGYVDQSVGPRSIYGDPLGGKALAKQTLELRFAVAVNPIPIYLLTFAEGGNVYSSFAKADFLDLARSAGFGARLQIMPIGLLGFDYGYGFDDVYPRNGQPDGWRFHFVFGRGF